MTGITDLDVAFASRIEALEAALRSADKLNEYIAEHYILSLGDFRYLDMVSAQIRAALGLKVESA
jgi:hypothetical protein